MARPRLHLDADASRKDLQRALILKSHDVTRTPAPGLPLDASDEFQLLWASANERVLFTFNIGNFLQLTRRIPNHRGILLASQQSYSVGELIALIYRVLTETEREDWIGQVRWLADRR
jgi:hypothetical protein